jgi:hypothetical protein
MPAVSEFPNEATSFEDDDYMGIDQKVGSLYVTKKIKKSNAFPKSYFRTSMGNPPLGFSAGAILSPVIFNQCPVNTNSEYNTSTGRFTPLHLGIYELSLACRGQGLVVGDIPIFAIYGGASGNTFLCSIQSAAYNAGGGPAGVSRGFTSIIIDHSVAGDFYRILLTNPSANSLTITPGGDSYFMGKRIA